MQITSVMSYTDLKASGKLGELQQKAYEKLLTIGPSTGQELSTNAAHPGLWKRLSELKKYGLVVEAGKRQCYVTGKTCLVWAAVVSVQSDTHFGSVSS